MATIAGASRSERRIPQFPSTRASKSGHCGSTNHKWMVPASPGFQNTPRENCYGRNTSSLSNMKTWTLRFRAIDRDDFNELKRGLKVVETRAGTERYRSIKAGDLLVFVCGKEKLKKKVKRARHFKTIAAMLRAIPLKKIIPSVSSPKEMSRIYYGYSGYKAKIKKFGIVAMEL